MPSFKRVPKARSPHLKMTRLLPGPGELLPGSAAWDPAPSCPEPDHQRNIYKIPVAHPNPTQVHPVHPVVLGTGARRRRHHHPDVPLACAGWNPNSAAPPAPAPTPGHQVPAPVIALREPPTSQPRALRNCPREARCAGHGDQTGPGVTSAREAGTEAGSGGKCERRVVGNGATPSPVALRLLLSAGSGARGALTLPATCASELI